MNSKLTKLRKLRSFVSFEETESFMQSRFYLYQQNLKRLFLHQFLPIFEEN